MKGVLELSAAVKAACSRIRTHMHMCAYASYAVKNAAGILRESVPYRQGVTRKSSDQKVFPLSISARVKVPGSATNAIAIFQRARWL